MDFVSDKLIDRYDFEEVIMDRIALTLIGASHLKNLASS
jgi:hypothetical protein